MKVGGRREGARERAVVHSAAATAPALAAAVAPAHRTPSYPSLLAGQRMYDGDGCDADISEIPRFKRLLSGHGFFHRRGSPSPALCAAAWGLARKLLLTI